MGIQNLTHDEQIVRSFYLGTKPSRGRALSSEVWILLPAIILAISAYSNGAMNNLIWISFLYLLGAYIWRFGSTKWSLAMRGLLEKYEHRIAELETQRVS